MWNKVWGKTLRSQMKKNYEEQDRVKKVPISDVSEAGRHKAWIVEHEKRITKGANVYTILITNSDGRIEESIEWYLKMIKSSCEENCIKAKYIFDKVVKFIFHGSSSPFCLRCHYKAQRGILLAKIKK